MHTEIAPLIGLTMTSVVNDHNVELIFTADNGRMFKFYHQQDCCESVSIEDVVGNLNDLVGSPILRAEESSDQDQGDTQWGDSTTWTFYRFATEKGHVDVRWVGTSNGYYSERVDFEEIVVDSQPN